MQTMMPAKSTARPEVFTAFTIDVSGPVPRSGLGGAG